MEARRRRRRGAEEEEARGSTHKMAAVSSASDTGKSVFILCSTPRRRFPVMTIHSLAASGVNSHSHHVMFGPNIHDRGKLLLESTSCVLAAHMGSVSSNEQINKFPFFYILPSSQPHRPTLFFFLPSSE